ncbi:PIN domain-like protein [Limtongia smithiae]|uniref:PIN domain-like protein n=1 Tax=Limtongia smithiae TaxID=1125753 RepID=UPI0034CD9F33
MGISGLLPLLKSIQQPTHVKEFAGQVVGVDGYVWLHRGAHACAVDLALGRPTRKYVDYAIHRVRMLKYYGVKPYLVFDGANLPSKKHIEVDRHAARQKARELAIAHQSAGRSQLAYEQFQKCIDITPAMASQFISALEQEQVPYVVAPYEADAQLAYLQRIDAITAVISEDSDLLVYGIKCLLTKLSDYGDCIAVRKARISSCTAVDFSSFDDTLFRHMAILAGCDYTPGIPNIGLRKAHMFLRRFRNVDRALRFMALEAKVQIPQNFRADFERADKTFLHQRVYCPMQKKVVMLSQPDGGALDEAMDFYVGQDIPQDIAIGIATGRVHPSTHEPIEIIPYRAGAGIPRRSTFSGASGGTAHPSTPITARTIASTGMPITAFFKQVESPQRDQGEIRTPFRDITNIQTASSATTTTTAHHEDEDKVTKRLRRFSPSPRPISAGTGEDCSGGSMVFHSRYFSAMASVHSASTLRDEGEEAKEGKDFELTEAEERDLLAFEFAESEEATQADAQNWMVRSNSVRTATATTLESTMTMATIMSPASSVSSSMVAATPTASTHKEASPSPASATLSQAHTAAATPIAHTQPSESSAATTGTLATLTPLLSSNRFLHFRAPGHYFTPLSSSTSSTSTTNNNAASPTHRTSSAPSTLSRRIYPPTPSQSATSARRSATAGSPLAPVQRRLMVNANGIGVGTAIVGSSGPSKKKATRLPATNRGERSTAENTPTSSTGGTPRSRLDYYRAP